MSKAPSPDGGPKGHLAIQKVFGANLRSARERMKMSQDDLAIASHLSRTHITRIETGSVNPSLDTADSLARAVKLRVRDLLVAPEDFDQESEQPQTSGTLPLREGMLSIEVPERNAFVAASVVAKEIGKPVHIIEPATREIRAVVPDR